MNTVHVIHPLSMCRTISYKHVSMETDPRVFGCITTDSEQWTQTANDSSPL